MRSVHPRTRAWTDRINYHGGARLRLHHGLSVPLPGYFSATKRGPLPRFSLPFQVVLQTGRYASGDPSAGARTSRRSSSALDTTVMLDADMARAPNSGRSRMPKAG